MTSRSTKRYPRTARLNEVVLEVLADELERLSDPRLELVTLTGVEVAGDLHRASVYYSTLARGKGSIESETATGEAFTAAAPHLRSILGRSIRVKRVPELFFEQDPGIVAGQRIEEILRNLHSRGSE